MLGWYRSFLDTGLRADVAPLAHDWEQYELLVLPTLFMLPDSAVQRLERYVRGGGTIVVGYATGIVNDVFQVGLGGYPGAGDGLLRTMLGVSGEEFNILGLDETVELSDGSISRLDMPDANRRRCGNARRVYRSGRSRMGAERYAHDCCSPIR